MSQQHDQLLPAGAPPPSVPPAAMPPGVAALVAQAELHASSVTQALQHYEAALEQLNAHIKQQQQAPQQREAAIAAFASVLHDAERLKQQHAADPAGAEYCWRRRQAQKLAEQVCLGGCQAVLVCMLLLLPWNGRCGVGRRETLQGPHAISRLLLWVITVSVSCLILVSAVVSAGLLPLLALDVCVLRHARLSPPTRLACGSAHSPSTSSCWRRSTAATRSSPASLHAQRSCRAFRWAGWLGPKAVIAVGCGCGRLAAPSS